MVQEKLEHCDTFCILRPADGKSRPKSLIHGPDYFDRNYEFQCKKTETAASDIKIPKGEEVSFLERRIINIKSASVRSVFGQEDYDCTETDFLFLLGPE